MAVCTLYNVKASRAEIASYFGAQDEWRRDLDKDYVATSRAGWVVIEREGKRKLGAMTWGFPPPDAAKGPVVNVRNLSSPFWQTALSNPARRCLVPATEFSEWSAKMPDTGKAVLHWFSIPSRPIFALAGIWRPVADGGAYAFLTTEPNPLVGAIHPKAMPVILDEDDYGVWLGGSYAEACALARPYPSQLMAMTQ